MYVKDNAIFKGEKCRPLGITLFAWYKTCFPQQRGIPPETSNLFQRKIAISRAALFIFASRFQQLMSDSSFAPTHPPMPHFHLRLEFRKWPFHHTTTHEVFNGLMQQRALMVFFL